MLRRRAALSVGSVSFSCELAGTRGIKSDRWRQIKRIIIKDESAAMINTGPLDLKVSGNSLSVLK